MKDQHLKDSLAKNSALIDEELEQPQIFASTSDTVKDSPSQVPTLVDCKVKARIPFHGGEFYLHLYKNNKDQKEHLAIVFGNSIQSKSLNSIQPAETELDRKIRGATLEGVTTPSPPEIPLVRIHSECYTGETVSSIRCDCGYQLAEAMRLMSLEGSGVIVYLRQEGRNIGLMEKLKAYNLQDMGNDTVKANLLLNHPADARTYDVALAILDDLSINRLNLLTNNPDKIEKITQDGSIIVENRVPMIPSWWKNDDEEEVSVLNTVDSLSSLLLSSSEKISNDKLSADGIPDLTINSAALDSSPDTQNNTDSGETFIELDMPHTPIRHRGCSTPPRYPANSTKSTLSYIRHLDNDKLLMTEADRYLLTKALKMGHILEMPKY
ncbi:putative GTP cyclohydrolase-2 [Smittium mucronatum]|uniref:GTP cyclohydrolase II n=1 Tax=Smittium mucronatum TaxID=133383 RepID=A0A1R0H4G5_9FUNG|nr:putative GTP cyclohydrolase-2 [Smittium mucronatum]